GGHRRHRLDPRRLCRRAARGPRRQHGALPAAAVARLPGRACGGLDGDLHPHGRRAAVAAAGTLLGNPRMSRWLLIAGIAILLVLPLIGHVFYTRLATRILIFAIIAIGLNLIVGYTGLVSFGHAAFVGLGAYTVAIPRFHGFDSGFLAWPAAIAFSALGALVIGAVALRTSGLYFIMITLAFAQMLFFLVTGLH